MWWFKKLGLISLLFVLGCGYHLATSSPIILPGNITRIYLPPISNPTTYPSLSQLVKSTLIDEFSKRNSSLKWTDKTNAQGELDVEIVDYGSTTAVENANEQTLKLSVCLTIRASLYSNNSTLLWDSGYVKNCEIIPSSDQEVSSATLQRVTKDTIDKLLSLLALKF